MKLLEKIKKYLKRKSLLYAFKLVKIEYIFFADDDNPYLCHFIKSLFHTDKIRLKIRALLISEIEKDLKVFNTLEHCLHHNSIKGFNPISTSRKALRIEYLNFKIKQYGRNKNKNK
jgi:hypothetical protein